jgi:hypothetical protein
MAALNFPNSPTVNDEVELGGKTYKWDGVKWLMIKVVSPSEQALAPTITEVSTTETSITFTITNNDASTAVILYEVGDSTPDENSIELATGVTSDSIEITGLDIGTEYTVSATASVTGKVLSNVTSLAIETDALIYTAATGGTTLDYDLDSKRYRSHTFTSDDDFIVTTVGDNIDDRNKVDYLIIAGGGSGAKAYGGGGGAGGYQTSLGTSGADSSALSKVTVTAQTYGIVVGAGGAARTTDGRNNGTNSTALGVTASVGGGGGGNVGVGGQAAGADGGSGGGGTFTGDGLGGTGTALQGRNGGAGEPTFLTARAAGGGGGGASEVGEDAPNFDNGGNGGDGLANLLRTGSNETRAGGGGGAIGPNSTGSAGAGGSGGGGAGVKGSGTATSGTVNTGSGGGGTQDGTSGAGGSGIVVIRYEIAPSV